MYIRLANLDIGINNKYSEIEEFCRGYIIHGQVNADFTVSTTSLENQRSKDWYRFHENLSIDDGVAERDWMQHKINEQLPLHHAFWMHACVVEAGGEAYAFSAPSGYGKTTHAKLWLDLLGNRARIINGDNPIITRVNGRFYAYGTPWCGKEGWGVNIGIPLRAVCYIMQSENNTLRKIEPEQALYRLIGFSGFYQNKSNINQMLSLYEQFVEEIPFYQLDCNMELNAARVSYEGMSGQLLQR